MFTCVPCSPQSTLHSPQLSQLVQLPSTELIHKFEFPFFKKSILLFAWAIVALAGLLQKDPSPDAVETRL